MNLDQVIILALIQGLTEFLPISSSAHLIIASNVWSNQSLTFDLAVHFGTLLAVLVYFRHTIKITIYEWLFSGFTHAPTPEAKLGWYVFIGTIPACIFGLLFKDFIETYLRSNWVIALTTIIFGLVLGYASYINKKPQKDEYQLTWLYAVLIGLAQAIALIPGTSRSGITITMAMFLGFSSKASARFSFLLAIPIIFLASMLQLIEVISSEVALNYNLIFIGVICAFLTAFACIHYFLKFISQMGMLPFVIYRCILGAGLLIWYFN